MLTLFIPKKLVEIKDYYKSYIDILYCYLDKKKYRTEASNAEDYIKRLSEALKEIKYDTAYVVITIDIEEYIISFHYGIIEKDLNLKTLSSSVKMVEHIPEKTIKHMIDNINNYKEEYKNG